MVCTPEPPNRHLGADALERAVASLGGTRREGQVAMAQAVANAFAERHHLLVQAGTGTGKSLAYLVPTLQHLEAHGGTAVVATATLALQRQILTSDLPLAEAAVGGSLKTALLKGRSNYLCRHRLAGGYPSAAALFDLDTGAGDHRREDLGLGAQVLRLREWAGATETGDVDELRPGPSPRAWRQVSVTSRECLAAKCPLLAQCFAEQARLEAAGADLVVTNHTLLALHAASDHPVLPDFDVLVVDEAHELADRITSALTAKLSTAAVERAVRAAGGAGIAADALAEAAVGLGPHLDHLTEGRIAGGLPPALAAAILAAREGARAAWRAAGEAEGETDGDRQFARAQLEELVEVCNSIGGAGTGDVLWAAPVSDDAPTLALNIAPLSVAEMIPTAVFAGATAILTSATLSLGDDFAAAAGAAGLDPADRDNVWRGLDVGSPFDYASQGIVYVAASLPPPDRDGTPPEQMDTLARLIDAAGGGTLGLFTSRAAATRAAEEMRRRLDVPILAQGDEALAAMVERFREELDTCLFGTISLWQGVDVPGPACRLVTIDRIAFPRPDDPICSARADAADQAGGSGFMTVSVAHAALMLAQGAGRLIRRSTDRGVVAILDPRLVTKRYGSALRRALPPLWPTTDLDLTCQALTRLRG